MSFTQLVTGELAAVIHRLDVFASRYSASELVPALVEEKPELTRDILQFKQQLDDFQQKSEIDAAGRSLRNRLELIERDFKRLHDQVKEHRSMAKEVLSLRNRMDAIWYSSRLLAIKPTESAKLKQAIAKEVDQAIRYVAEVAVSDEAVWRTVESVFKKPYWLLLPMPLLAHEPTLKKFLPKIRDAVLLSRPAGPRGDLAAPAATEADKTEFLVFLREKFKTAGSIRSEIALLLGEWGGAKDSTILRECLHSVTSEDQAFAQNLISAITTIGGPEAVSTLMELAETKGPNPLASIALSNLEYLSSAGSIALTEAPEPPSINTPELLMRYRDLGERLRQLSRSQDVDKYIRYKAHELLQTTIQPALRQSF